MNCIWFVMVFYRNLPAFVLRNIKNLHQEFTFDRFERAYFGVLNNINVYSFFDTEIQQMQIEVRSSSMNVATPFLSRLKEFHPKELRFVGIDTHF